MLNCPNCGAPLSLDQAYCSHCGTPNPEAQEHLKKLKQLDRQYNKTRMEVVNEVRSSKKGYNILLVLVLLLLANFVVLFLHAGSYEIADRIALSRFSPEEVRSTLDELIEKGEYIEFAEFINKYDLSYREYPEYLQLSYLAGCYSSVCRYVNNYFYVNDTYSDPLVYACSNIRNFKDEYERYSQRDVGEFVLTHMQKMNAEFDLYLKANLNLSDEDISRINELSESELLVMIAGRLTDEKQ